MKLLIYIIFALLIFHISPINDNAGNKTETESLSITEEEAQEDIEAFIEESIEIDDWVRLNLTDFYNDEFSQRVLNFGVQWVISQFLIYGAVQNDSIWNISRVDWVDIRELDGVDYRIHMVLDAQYDYMYSREGAGIEAVESILEFVEFVVELEINTNSSINKIEILALSYAQGEGAGLPATEELDITESEIPSFLEIEGPVQIGYIFPEATAEPQEGGFWEMDPKEESSHDQKIYQQHLKAGVEEAIQKGLNVSVLPEGNWTLFSVEKTEELDYYGNPYLYFMTLTDGDLMRARGVVFVYDEGEAAPTGNYGITSGFWAVGPVNS